MSKAKIAAWLSNDAPDYDEGLALLRSHSNNRVLLNALAKKDNAFNRQKLRYELEKAGGALPDEAPAEPTGAGDPNQEPTGQANSGIPANEPTAPDAGTGASGSGDASPAGPGGVVVKGTEENTAGDGHGEQLPGPDLPPAISISADTGTGVVQVWEDEAAGVLAGIPGQKFDPILAGLPVGSIQAPGGPSERPGHLLMDDPGKVLGASEEVQEALNEARKHIAEGAGVPVDALKLSDEVLARFDKLATEGAQVYLEKARLSNSLRTLDTDADRKKVVDNIDTLERRIQEINSQKEYIIQHNRLPDPAPAPAGKPLSREELIQDRNNLRSRVSKAKAAVKNNPADVRKQEALAKLEAELQQVEDTLKTMDQ